MATKLNCFDSGKESRCRESVSRKPYDVPYRFYIRQPDDETARDPVEPLRMLANALAMIIKTAELYSQIKEGKNHDPAQG